MELHIPLGAKRKQHVTVRMKDTAFRYGSGLVDVYATPAMIALMENTAQLSVKPYLPEGHITVGTAIDIRHHKATPVGMKVTCESVLTAVEGKKLTFSVTAWDEKGLIGSGSHSRYIVNTEEFLNRLR
ncbi:MAG: thioesterase family protein [Bacteroidetes bacterium]|nr:thioesterase family protein [Bacteroidota bacterium]